MMYNQSPEEYMRNVLGYMPANTYETDRYVYQSNGSSSNSIPQAPRMESYMENYPTMMNSSVNTMPRIGMQSNPVMPVMENSELEEMYPDIYRLLKPMVEKKCRETTGKNNSRSFRKDDRRDICHYRKKIKSNASKKYRK